MLTTSFKNSLSLFKKKQPLVASSEAIIDISTKCIKIDPSKCAVGCQKCINVCESFQFSKPNTILKTIEQNGKQIIQTTSGKSLKDTNCIKCGLCTFHCPTGALKEYSQADEVMSQIAKKDKKLYVCEISPSTHISIAESLGLKPGQISPGQIVNALHKLGFDLVLDSKFGADLMVMEEAVQLVERLKNTKANNSGGKGGRLPLVSSFCPAFLNYLEKSHFSPSNSAQNSQNDSILSHIKQHLSTTRSASSIISAIIKEDLPGKRNIKSTDIYNVSITTCLAEKNKVLASNVKETDVSLTARELAEIIKKSGIKLSELKPTSFDRVFGEGSGSSNLIDAAGGVTDAVLRTANWILSGNTSKERISPQIVNLNINQNNTNDKNYDPIKIVEVGLGKSKIKIASVQGIRNAISLLGDPQNAQIASEIKYIEVVACPGGCACGGGSSCCSAGAEEFGEMLKRRLQTVVKDDSKAMIWCAHQNPSVHIFYQNTAKKQKKVKTQNILHTSYP